METVYVGVSGINAVDNPGPGIGVARSLKEDRDLNVRIVGLAYDAMEPGIYMDWIVDKSFLMPYPSGSGAAYLERLLQIKQSYGLDCVIPNLDSRVAVLHQVRRASLRRAGHPHVPAEPEPVPSPRQGQAVGAGRSRSALRLPKTDVVTSRGDAGRGRASDRPAGDGQGLLLQGLPCPHAAGRHRPLPRPGGRMGLPGDRAGSGQRRRTERGRPGRRRRATPWAWWASRRSGSRPWARCGPA